MNDDKENLDPNRSHSSKHSIWVKRSRGPKISKFQGFDSDWRKKIMMPSDKEREIEGKLTNMLQRSSKECLKTNLTQDRFVSSFMSSENYTLHKYCQQNPNSTTKPIQANRKKELVEILQLSQSVACHKASKLEECTEEDLLRMIKKTLSSVISN